MRPRGDIVHPRDRPHGEATFVGLEHIESNTGRRIGAKPIRLEGLVGRKARFYPGDIVYGYLRPYLNKVWLADFEGYCSVDQYVFQVDRNLADPGYVAHFLRSSTFLSMAPIHLTPGQLPRIRTEEVLGVQFWLPPLLEQQRIAAELRTESRLVDDLRVAARARRAEYEHLVQKCLAKLILTGPEGDWREVLLTDVADIQLGKMLSPASKVGTRPVSYLRNANVQWDDFDLSEVFEMDFSEAEERKFQLKAGDVLVCEGGEPGRAAIWAGEIERCCYQKALHRLRPIADAVDPRFLMYRLWLGALRAEFVDRQAATTIAHLPAVRLANLKVRLPNVSEQRRIAARLREELEQIDAVGAALGAEQRAIDALSSALLRRAFAQVP